MKKYLFFFSLVLALQLSAQDETINGTTFKQDGKVGIGTASPLAKLDVKGRIMLSQGTIQRGGTPITGTTDLGLYSHLSGHWVRIVSNNAPIRFFTDIGNGGAGNDVKMAIEANGNIGIGTASPQLKLHIKDPAGGAAYGIERGGKLWRWDIQNTGDKIWLGNTDAPNLYEYGNQGTFQVSTEYSSIEKARVYVKGNGTRNDGVTPNLVSGGLVSGNTDNAKFGKFNVALESWYGIGFRSSFNNKEGIVFNTRTASAFFEGDVGVGTDNTQGFKLGVNGKIAATEVKVATYANWPDYVFDKDYNLPTLQEVEQHIKEKGYLKDIPTAEDVKKDGFFLGDMDSKLLQKIEELTLYTIEQEKEIEALKKENEELKSISKRLTDIEKLLGNKNNQYAD